MWYVVVLTTGAGAIVPSMTTMASKFGKFRCFPEGAVANIPAFCVDISFNLYANRLFLFWLVHYSLIIFFIRLTVL